MDIQFYETFLEVANTLNFRAASENLEVVQSTVSNRIQALEEFYGQPLFNRSNKKVTLTSVGHMVLPYAKRMVALQSEALQITKQIKVRDNKLKIAIEPKLYTKEMKKTIKNYLNKNTDVQLSVEIIDSSISSRKIVDGLIDIAFVYNKSSNKSLVFIPHHRDPIAFIADNSINISSNKSLSKEDVLKLNLIKMNYSSKFDKWLNQFIPPEYEFSLVLSSSVNPVDQISGLERAGFVLQSELEESPHASEVRAYRIENMDMPYFQSYIAYRNEKSPSSIISNFLESINLQ